MENGTKSESVQRVHDAGVGPVPMRRELDASLARVLVNHGANECHPRTPRPVNRQRSPSRRCSTTSTIASALAGEMRR
jgi:hypothetical protein